MAIRIIFLALLLASATLAQAPAESPNAILDLCNSLRRQASLPQLKPHPSLGQAAAAHSQEMIRLNYFSHNSPTANRVTPAARVNSLGFHPQKLAENIYATVMSATTADRLAAECVNSWMESPGHRANILNPAYIYAGAGIARSGNAFRVTLLLSDESHLGENKLPTATESGREVSDSLLRETNKRRADIGLPALQTSLILDLAARSHSEEMLRLKYFSHQSPNSERARVRQRVRAAGANPRLLGENIYRCQGYAANTVALRAILAFMESDGHRANILNPSFKQIGIGVAQSNGEYYVTQVFSGD